VNRGCKVIKQAGGTITSLFKNEMSRAPCLSFDSAAQSLQCAQWIKDPYNFSILKVEFPKINRRIELFKGVYDSDLIKALEALIMFQIDTG
jgi:hydroxymethylglutaryl-CoA reductase